MAVPTCADLTARLGVDTAGTASVIRSWLLLEHPGPWGEDSRERVFQDALGDRGWRRLETLWLREQLRPLLIRRPASGRRRPTAEPVLLLGSTVGPQPFLERVPARILPDLDLAAIAAGQPGHGEPVDGSIFAVCTNGAVDRCCAIRGRPLAAALAQAYPGRTWEATHLGGCRFAPNLLVLPSGVAHGSLTPEAGLTVAAAAVRGQIDHTGLRGRTGTGASHFAGAAEVVLRRRFGLHDPADVEIVAEMSHDDLVQGEEGPEPAGADVLLRAGVRLWRAVVRTRDLGVHAATCGDAAVTTIDVLSIEPATPRPGDLSCSTVAAS